MSIYCCRSVKNVSNKVLLTGPKIQAKIPSHSGDCVLGERQFVRPPSNGEGLRDIEHSMSMVIDTSLTFDSLWQFITKCDRSLLQNATKCDRYSFALFLHTEVV